VFAIIGARSPDETALLADPLPILDQDDVAQLDAAHSAT